MCTKEIISGLNITCHDQNIHQDDNHLTAIDSHSTELLSQLTKQSPKVSIYSESTQNAHSVNSVYLSASGTYLEHQKLLKTSKKNVTELLRE